MIIIFAILGTIFIPFLLLRYSFQYLKLKTDMTRLILIGFSALGFGLIYSCARTLSFLVFGGIDGEIDLICFYITVFLALLAVNAAIQIIFILSKQAGHPVKGASIIRYFYLILTFVITFLNLIFNNKSNLYEFGYYVFQLHPLIFYLIIGFYVPLILFVCFRLLIILKEIKSKRVLTEISVVCVILAALIVERYFNMIYISPPIYHFLLFNLSFITVIWVSAHIFLSIDPEFLENVSSYFGAKSLYIMRKDNGQIIYTYEFRKDETESALIENKILLGGFMFAISSGLEDMLEVPGKIEFINFGSITILFTHGNYVFGTMLARDQTPIIQRRFRQFLSKFEFHYKDVLESSMDDLSLLNTKEIDGWITDIFK